MAIVTLVTFVTLRHTGRRRLQRRDGPFRMLHAAAVGGGGGAREGVTVAPYGLTDGARIGMMFVST